MTRMLTWLMDSGQFASGLERPEEPIGVCATEGQEMKPPTRVSDDGDAGA